MRFEAFETWEDVLAVVDRFNTSETLRYKAPMDFAPRSIIASRCYRGGKVVGKRVRVLPLSNQADPFYADAGHLDRFWRVVKD